MKKYLITGAMALVAGFYLTSCTHDDIGYDNLYEEKTQSFEKVFKDLYGTIDPNHDWGFTPYAIDGLTTVNATRALTRGHYANANMWATEWIVPNALTEAQKDKVRRWFQQNRNPEGVAFSHKDFFVQQVYKGGTTVGNNSPEKYTAADGTTSFAGSDRMDYLSCGSYGEGASTEYNSGRNIYDHINNFNNGTYSGGSTVDVLNNNEPIGGATHPDQIMLMVDSKSDCFGYWNSNGSVGFNNKYVIIPGDVIQAWDSDGGDNANVSGMYFVGLDFEQAFETAYTNDYYTGPDGNKYRYLDSNMNMYCGDKKEYNDIPSAETIQGLLDQGYLPVASKDGKVFVKLASCADGYYSDWIVRVIPGTKKSSGGGEQPKEEETTTSKKFKARRHQIVSMGRVFVEDLYNANRADIDYNDAVFDGIIWVDYTVQIERDDQGNETITEIEDGQKKFRVEIALLAAGGTIPLKIAESKFGDVHTAFGVGLTTIVNTVGEASNVFGSSVTGKDYVYKEFDYTDEINAIFNAGGWPTLNSIPIDVEWVTGDVKVAARLNNKETRTYQKDENGRLVVDGNGDPIIVESSAPVVPHVIQVPIGTAWPQERVNIGLKDEGPYHLFPNYVEHYDDYKDRVWVEDVDNFYLYQDNRSPLAYSDKWPSWSYLTDIDPIVETLIPPVYLYSGAWSEKIPASYFNDVTEGMKLKIYGEALLPTTWGNESQIYIGIYNGYNQSFPDAGGNLYNTMVNGCITVELTQAIIDNCKSNNGLMLGGTFFNVTKVEIVP